MENGKGLDACERLLRHSRDAGSWVNLAWDIYGGGVMGDCGWGPQQGQDVNRYQTLSGPAGVRLALLMPLLELSCTVIKPARYNSNPKTKYA